MSTDPKGTAEAAHQRCCWRVGGPVTLDDGLCPECGWHYTPSKPGAWHPTNGTARPPDGARCAVSRTNLDGDECFGLSLYLAVPDKWDESIEVTEYVYKRFDYFDHFYALPERT